MKKVLLLLLVLSLGAAKVYSQESESQAKKAVLEAYFDLYNDHQVESLVDMVQTDFKMYSITEDTVTTDIIGREQLKK